ncbi:MAG: hypothetical protein QM775_12465 [Pirellulales bacterium]
MTLAQPESTTAVTPSIVREVSATFVDRMTLRRSSGRSTRLLLVQRHVAVEREQSPIVAVGIVREQLFRAANLADAGQKHENVPHGLFGNRTRAAGRLPFDGVIRREFLILDGHRKCPAQTFDRRAIAQITRDRGRGERGRHHDDAQVGTHFAAHATNHGERQVGIEAPLVELVEDHGGDVFQKRIVLQPAEEHAFGANQKPGTSRRAAFEADLIADFVAHFGAAFFRDAHGSRTSGHAARLQEDDLPATLAAIEFRQAGLKHGGRHARGFARTGRGFENHGPVRTETARISGKASSTGSAREGM